ncbi:hypothetical protein BsWGS_08235 [Bradybaena similaris]
MSQSPGGSHEGNNSDESIVLIPSSSSEDENDVVSAFHFTHSLSTDRRTIRELVLEGKRLLTLAEAKSCPEDFRNDAAMLYRYNFSSAVTGSDLFRDRELGELVDLVSLLKMRLSAERAFSLGCPQLRSERDVFDELLMRFSDEFLNLGQSIHSANRSEESSSANTGSQSSTDVVSSRLTVNVDNETVSAAAQAGNELIQHLNIQDTPVTDHLYETIGEAQNGLVSRERVQENVSTSSSQLDGQSLNINISNLEDFLAKVRELSSLASPTQTVSNRVCAPVPYRIIQAIQTSLSSITGTASANQSTFRQVKRRRSEEDNCEATKKSKSKIEDSRGDEDKEEDSCSICLEAWSTGGEHRVTCLKCGHLFGLSCIVKWVEQAHCCPQCKASAKKSDLRHIFVRKITAEDTSQRDRALRLLEEERASKRSIEQKEAMARKKLETQASDIDALKAENTRLKAQLSDNGGCVRSQAAVLPTAFTIISRSQSVNNKHFYPFQRVPISPDGNCRVFDHCKELGLVVASQKSPNALFRGYGIKILTRDFRPLAYHPLHSAIIRDMCFRPSAFDGMLLSCGLDKCLQLTSVTTKVVVQKYNVNSAVWCCAWNTQNTNLFYAGMERGVVREFDIRRTDSHVQDVLDNGGSPITNIQYWNGQVDGNNLQGLLIAHLQSLIFAEHTGEQFTSHHLPHLQAPLMSLSLHPSGKYLSSFRPSSSFPRCRYEICNLCQSTLEGLPTPVSSNCQAKWEGSNMQAIISRNCLMSKPESEDGLLAITANHFNNTVNVWDVNKRQELQTLACFDKAIDIRPLNDDLLGVLTDKELVLYNWRS